MVFNIGDNKKDNYDNILVESGAQVCVCPRNYAPEAPLYWDEFDVPILRTVTNTTIEVYGYKYVT